MSSLASRAKMSMSNLAFFMDYNIIRRCNECLVDGFCFHLVCIAIGRSFSKQTNSIVSLADFFSLFALTNSVVLSLDDFLLIACHVYTLCFLGCHTSLEYIPIPIADQAAK